MTQQPKCSVFKDIRMDNKTLTESMSALSKKLQLIESITNEATTGAAEKAAEKLGIGTAKSALRNIAQKAREKLAAAKNKIAPAGEKKTAAPAPAAGNVSSDTGGAALQNTMANFARGKGTGTLAADTLPSIINRGGETWEKVGSNYINRTTKEVLPADGIAKSLETKALSSGLSSAEKAEIKSGGIFNWMKKNPGKTKALGLLGAAAVAGGTAAYMMSGDKEEPTDTGTVEPLPSTNTTTQITPEQAEQKILAIIKELEPEPACAEDVAKIKAELARIKSGQVATPVSSTAPDPTAPDPKWMAAIEAIKKATGKSDQEVRDMVSKIRMGNPTATPEQVQAQLAGAPATANTPIPPGGMMTGKDITGRPVMKGSPNDVSAKQQTLNTVTGGLQETDELTRWLKIARG